MANDTLPEPEAGKLYLVTPATLKALLSIIRSNRPRAVEGGGIEVEEQGEDGVYLRLSKAEEE